MLRRGVLAISADGSEQAADLAQRSAPGFANERDRFLRLVGTFPHGCVCTVGDRDHDGEAVRDDVVHLTRDPFAFQSPGDLRLLVSFPSELLRPVDQLLDVAPAVTHVDTEQRRDEEDDADDHEGVHPVQERVTGRHRRGKSKDRGADAPPTGKHERDECTDGQGNAETEPGRRRSMACAHDEHRDHHEDQLGARTRQCGEQGQRKRADEGRVREATTARQDRHPAQSEQEHRPQGGGVRRFTGKNGHPDGEHHVAEDQQGSRDPEASGVVVETRPSARCPDQGTARTKGRRDQASFRTSLMAPAARKAPAHAAATSQPAPGLTYPSARLTSPSAGSAKPTIASPALDMVRR